MGTKEDHLEYMKKGKKSWLSKIYHTKSLLVDHFGITNPERCVLGSLSARRDVPSSSQPHEQVPLPEACAHRAGPRHPRKAVGGVP